MKLSVEKLLELLPDFKLDRRGKNLQGPCPMCGHNEFGISIEEGHRFGCYRKSKCGFNGNIFVLLKHLGKLDEVVRERSVILPPRLSEIEIEEEDREVEELESISLPVGFKRVFKNDYMESRGFSEQDLRNYEVGVTDIDPRLKKKYIIFPCRIKGDVKGWVARRSGSKSEIDLLNEKRKEQGKLPVLRYINSLSDFAKILYGIDEVNSCTESLIVVEGIFDKIKVDKLLELYKTDQIKCVATFKGAISEEQVRLIKTNGDNIKNIILLYDSDIIKNIKKTIEYLVENSNYDILIGYHETKDPGDMNLEDLESVFERLETPLEFKSSKIEVNKL